ncbi:MAG: efflux RND transporter periplasmic adaptor subunit [Spirochaetota bacterium]
MRQQRNLKILIAPVVFIIFSFILGLGFFFRTPFIHWIEKQTHKQANHKHKTKKKLYTCPMHPQVIKDEPGTCPMCHMNLVPVKENKPSKEEKHKHNEYAAKDKLIVRVSPAVIQKSGIVTEVVKKKPIQREITSVAHIDYNESKETMINSRVTGWVEKLYVGFTGQTVKRGQALASIYSPELVSTQEEYLRLYQKQKASTSPELQKEIGKLLAAAKNRLLFWNISKSQISRIERTGKVNRRLAIYSPYSGVVVEKKVIEGAHIKQGTDLFKIIDLSTVWVFIHIPEQDIPFVKKGMDVEMTLPQIPGKSFPGKISFIFPFLEMKSRDLKVRASFSNPKFELKPGMYATLRLKETSLGEHVVIPSSAIIRSGVRNIVFIHHGEGRFEPKEVKLGVSDGKKGTQILQGLQEGDVIVTSSQFLLDSESKLQEAIQKMRSTPKATSLQGGHKH